MKRSFIIVLFLGLSPAVWAQQLKYGADTHALADAGKLENNSYVNDHAGFLIHLPIARCQPEINTQVDFLEGRAILLSCRRDVEGGGAYKLSIIAENWASDHLTSVKQYVDRIHDMGNTGPQRSPKTGSNSPASGISAVEPVTQRNWAGLGFEEIILRVQQRSGTYYLGASCTHLKNYVVCFRAQAYSLPLVRGLLTLRGKLEITNPPEPSKAKAKTKTRHQIIEMRAMPSTAPSGAAYASTMQ